MKEGIPERKPVDMIGHMRETNQVGSSAPSPANPQLEKKKAPTLEDVDLAIDQAFIGNRITLNTGDQSIAPQMISEIKAIVRDAQNWDDFNVKITTEYKQLVRTRFKQMNSAHLNYIMIIIDQAATGNAGMVIRKYFKGK